MFIDGVLKSEKKNYSKLQILRFFRYYIAVRFLVCILQEVTSVSQYLCMSMAHFNRLMNWFQKEKKLGKKVYNSSCKTANQSDA